MHRLEVDLHPGDILVFYSGWVHATTIKGPPSLSMSHFFSSPLPVPYLAVLGEHLLACNEYAVCRQRWEREGGVEVVAGKKLKEKDVKSCTARVRSSGAFT